MIGRIDVLCGCGWGLLGVDEDHVPDHCPQCSAYLKPVADHCISCGCDDTEGETHCPVCGEDLRLYWDGAEPDDPDEFYR